MAKTESESGTLVAKKLKKPGAAEPATTFVLPTKKTEVVQNLIGYIILLFGEKKIGKTSMLAEAEKTFFAFFEPGGKALELYAHVFPRWAVFRQAVNALVTEKPRRFNHVVIDTVDLAYKSAADAAKAKLGIEHEADAGYGKGWAAVREEFERPIMKLVNAGIAVTFVSHAVEADVTTRGGETYNKIVASMPKQARAMVEGLVDIWAYYGYDGERRILTIVGDEHVSAGHRLSKNFRTPTGEPVTHIDMGTSPAEAWKNFNDAFHNRYVPPVRTKKREDDEPNSAKKVFKKVRR